MQQILTNTHFAFSMKICILPKENMFLSLLYVSRIWFYIYFVSKLQFLLYSNIPVMGLLYQGLHFISPTYFSNTQFAGFYIGSCREGHNHLLSHYTLFYYISKGAKINFLLPYSWVKKLHFCVFLAFYDVMYHIPSKFQDCQEIGIFFSVLLFSYFKSIELFHQEKIPNFQTIKKFLGDM